MEKKVYSGDLGFFCKASHFILYLTFLITTTLADHVFHRLLWLQHMCIFMCKISIHSSSPMLTKKDKNWKKKKKKNFWFRYFLKGKNAFLSGNWVQSSKEPGWYFVSHCQVVLLPGLSQKKEKKYIKKNKLLGSMAASEVPLRVHLAEPDSQGWAAEVLQVMVHCWQWSRLCWEYQSLTSTQGLNPSCARERG